MYSSLLTAIKNGVEITRSTVERCFCILKGNNKIPEAVALFKATSIEEHRLADTTILHTIDELKAKIGAEATIDFLDAAASKGYPIRAGLRHELSQTPKSVLTVAPPNPGSSSTKRVEKN